MLSFIFGLIIGGFVGASTIALFVGGNGKTAKDYVMIDKKSLNWQ